MPDGLSLLLHAADALAAPVHLFIRDDDAGWDDARQLALLDTTASAGVPIDLAAIPQALSDALAAELRARIDARPQGLGVHQHGWCHADHQSASAQGGRRCEFGSARSAEEQAADIALGRRQLQHQLGPRLDTFFTPPWNRCAAGTPALLAGQGFTALSRDRGAPPQTALPELPVDVDWCKHQRTGGPEAVAQAMALALQARAANGQPGQPLGLMLHHAAMQADELHTLQQWLPELARHPHLRWCLMRQALAAARWTPRAPMALPVATSAT